MPTNVVKTPADEKKWQKAKARAKEQGKAENYAYIMGIYKSMNPERFKSASAQRVATRYAAQGADLDRLSTVVGWLDEGFPDMFEREYLQFGDSRPLERALSDYVDSLRGLLEQGRKEEAAKQEQERLEQERLEQERQEKERQKKERHDTFKKLERLADKVFKDWARERGDRMVWMFTTSPGRFPTVLKATRDYLKGAVKLLGGMEGIGWSEPRGYVRGFLNNGRMFDIKITADVHPVERDGSSMADLTLEIEQKE
jgi:hypothetical protein